MDPVKPPTTYAEQISILKKRNLTILDENFAHFVLTNLNYYRFTGYLLPFKTSDEAYADGTTFEHIFKIYEFDRKLRNLLIGMLEPVEISLRAKISYHFAHKYSALGYLSAENFRDERAHGKFISTISDSFKNAHKNRELVAIHHFEKYDGNFPLWVAVELMSFGNISKFYMNMHSADRSTIAKRIYGIPQEYLSSWMECLVYVRNMCAHYTRLYGKELKIKPVLFKDDKTKLINDYIFAAIFICKRLYHSVPEWNIFVTNLEALIDEYKDDINIAQLGFPHDWELLLRKRESELV